MARGRPVVIEFAANVRDYLRGTKDVERATEDIADELKEASRDSDKFERDFTSAMRDAEKQAARTSDRVETDFRGMSSEMGDIGQDAGDELISNLGETVSSGDIGGLIEGTLGGIVGGLKGPLGLAAAGLAGVAVVAFQKLQEEAEKTAQLVDSRVELMRERLGMVQADIDATFKREQKASWIEENLDYLQEMRPLLETAGIDAGEYADAMFEGGDAAQAMLDRIRGIRDTDKERITQGDRTRIIYGEQGQAANDVLTASQALVNSQKEVNDEARTYNAFLGDARTGVYNIQDAWNRVIDNMRRNSRIDIQGTINWYNEGPGAAYIDPRGSQYSPGHVAINNLYNRARNGTP
jgi:hypothetical protein